MIQISKSKHKFEQNHCFQWHRLTSQLFPRRLQRMKWASVANEIVHPLLQLLEIPSQNSTDFLSRVISDMRSANYCNCVFRFPCIAPDASSAPTPNCCCAASLLFFFSGILEIWDTQSACLSCLRAWKTGKKNPATRSIPRCLKNEAPHLHVWWWERALKKVHHSQTHATSQKSPPRTLSTHSLPKHVQRRKRNMQL